MKTFTPNTATLPNPGKLMESLRHTGYDNYNAIADIVDNSIDANANSIWIEIHQEKRDFVIRIVDDGSGMDEGTLSEALRLGSESDKNYESDLGRFGMGLCTAGLSMSRLTTVITKTDGDELLVGVNDLDWVIKNREFKSYVGKAGNEEKELFADFLEENNHGTIVTLSRSDRIQNPNVTNFANHLKKDLGQIFRRFIEAGKKFYVNGDLIAKVDPLMLNEANTIVYSDELYPIKLEVSNRTFEDSIRIRMVLVHDFGQIGNEDKGINYRNQGFSILRNERELFASHTLDVYTKDPHLNRFRGEVSFTGTLDELMGVHFTKRSFSMVQGLKDKIKEITRSQIARIRNMADEQRPKTEKEISHKEVEQLISKKSKLLIKPDAEPHESTKRDKKKGGESKEPTDIDRDGPHERLRRICSFEEASMDRLGPLFYPYMIGSKLVIRWNVDHPFYAKVFVPKKEDKTFVTAVDFLIYSLASAELKNRSDENISHFEEMRSHMSANLRVLLD